MATRWTVATGAEATAAPSVDRDAEDDGDGEGEGERAGATGLDGSGTAGAPAISAGVTDPRGSYSAMPVANGRTSIAASVTSDSV